MAIHTQNTDPRKKGVLGLPGLPGLGADGTYSNRRAVAESASLRNQRTLSTPTIQNVGNLFPEVGKSRLDRKGSILSNIQDIQNFRGEEQSGFNQIFNGILKAGVLAGTTFVSGVSLPYGLGMAIMEGDSSKIWDNDLQAAIKDLNDFSEKVFPNYYTDKELNSPWYQNIFTANFLGDKFIKNLGFTVGAFYSGGVYTKPLQAIKFLREAGVAAKAVSSLVGAGVSAVNEGVIEAYNNSTDWYNLEKAKLDDAYAEELSKIDRFKGTSSYDTILGRVNEKYENELSTIEYNRAKMGNADLLMNIPVLMASNLVEFGKLYSRGFSTARRLNNIVGTPGSYATNMSRGRMVAVATKKAVSEGVEEVMQKAVSNIAGAAYEKKNYNLSFNQASMDTDAEAQTVDWIKATAKGFAETMSDDTTWEEFFIGTLTGALGMPAFGRANNANAAAGRGRAVGLSGGILEEIRDFNQERRDTDNIVQRMNERVQSPEFLNYYQGLVRHNKFENDKLRAAQEGRAKEFKDAEYAQLISDVSMFTRAGRLDDFLAMLEEAYDTSDENLQKIVEATTQEVTTSNGTVVNVGPYIDSSGNPMFSTSEGRQEMIEKLTQAKQEIERAVRDYSKTSDKLDESYGDVFTTKQKDELIWLSLYSKEALTRAATIADSSREALREMRKSFETLLEESKGKNQTDYIRALIGELESSIDSIDIYLGRDSLELAMLLADNESLRNLIKENLKNAQLSDDFNIDDLNDLTSLVKDSRKFSETLEKYLNNPEELEATQNRERRRESRGVERRRKKEAANRFASATDFNSIRDVLNDATISDEEKAEGLRASDNPIVRDYNRFLDKIESIRQQVKGIAPEVREDVETLLESLQNNVTSLNELDDMASISTDPNIFQRKEGETDESLQKRFDKAVSIINSSLIDGGSMDDLTDFQDTYNDIDSFDIDDIGEDAGYNPEDVIGEEGEEEGPIVTGNSEVVEAESVTPESVEVKPEIKPENSNEGVLITPAANEPGATNITVDNVEPISEALLNEVKAQTAEISRDEVTPLEDIRPSTSKYDLSGMNSNTGVVFNPIAPAGQEARQYLANNGPAIGGSTDAFEWIDRGYLQEYKENGGKIYFGIDPSFDPAIPIMFVRIGEEYKAVGVLFKNDRKINSFKGLRELTDALREEAKDKDGIFISPSWEADVKTVTTGRIPYRNNARHSVNEALVGSEIDPEDLEIVVVSNGKYEGAQDRPSRYRASGNIRDGMSYIAVSNAIRRGKKGKGKTLVPIIPATYDRINPESSFAKIVESAIENLADALANNRRDSLSIYLKTLSQYLNLSRLNIVLTANGSVFFEEVENDNADGDENGKRQLSRHSINFIDGQFSPTKEKIVAAIKDALSQLNVPIRINKNSLDNQGYIQRLLESEGLQTYATTLKSEAAYFTIDTPVRVDPSQQQETKEEPIVTGDINPESILEAPQEQTTEREVVLSSEEIAELINVVFHNMEGNEAISEIDSSSLSNYGCNLDTEYTIDDILNSVENFDNSLPKDLVSRILEAARNADIKYIFTNTRPATAQNAYGSSYGDTVELYVDPSNKEFTHALLHETIHSFTNYLLRKDGTQDLTESQQKLVDEYKMLFDKARAAGVTNIYGAGVSINEFISELSNPEFREQLSQVKVEETNLFKKIVSWVKRIFGIEDNLNKRLDKLLERTLTLNLVDRVNRVSYMRPQPLVTSQEDVARLINEAKHIYTANKERAIQAALRINKAAGKAIASIDYGSVHEGQQFYIVSIRDLTSQEMSDIANNYLVRYSRDEIESILSYDNRQILSDLGVTDEELKLMNEDDIKYLLNCKGF